MRDAVEIFAAKAVLEVVLIPAFIVKANGKKVWDKIGWLSEGYSAKLASDLRADRIRCIVRQ